MATYKQWNHNMVYINNPGKAAIEEVLRVYKVTEDEKKWYDEINKYGYLVRYDDKVGFQYIVTEYHTGMPSNAERYKTAVAHGNRTPDSVWELVTEVATILAEKPLDVFVGRRVGVYDEHRLGVFFPYGTDPSVILQNIDLVNETMKKTALKKWNSLVDLVMYD